MAKKGPIGKVEAFYIEKHYLTVDVKQIASDLDRPIAAVENYIKKHLDNGKKTGVKAGDHFARRPGVVTMTENASMLGDSKKKKIKPTQSCVIKIKNDK